MLSVLQLPPVLREPHDEDDDVLGPHPGVSIRMWVERLCVCVCVRVSAAAHKRVCETRQESTQWATLENNDLNQVQVLFYHSSVFTKTPPACFHRQVTITSCSLSL